ncbi:MAG TPA: gliding motility-associated C-terminal domain-containing protein [Bacteroidales bacterium]|nr:gliding motility-associated C-terminal domain-containing protein [Bacteroidales bacterium]
MFDRWGKILFHTNNIHEGWDGNINGKPAPEGVYAYRIFYRDATKTKKIKYGHVVLYR